MKVDNILFDFQTISLYHVRMVEIKSSDIEKAVYELCVNANTMYDAKLYTNLIQKFNNACGNDKIKYSNILKNIKLSFETKRPLCQDTGQVIVFAKIGNKVTITGKTFNEAVNNAVEKAYTENFYRKSIVTNTLFNRANTRTNTPAIIYTDIVDGDNIHIDLTAKGAGSENCSVIKMFNPSAAKTDIFRFIKDSVILAGEKSCPPLVLGIGAGGTLEYAALLSKKAFFHTPDEAEQQFIDELREYLKDIEESILDIRLCTASTHIASLPVALTISCHSTRHAGCTIKGNDIFYQKNTCDYLQTNDDSSFREVSSCDTETIRSLLPGENILRIPPSATSTSRAGRAACGTRTPSPRARRSFPSSISRAPCYRHESSRRIFTENAEKAGRGVPRLFALLRRAARQGRARQSPEALRGGIFVACPLCGGCRSVGGGGILHGCRKDRADHPAPRGAVLCAGALRNVRRAPSERKTGRTGARSVCRAGRQDHPARRRDGGRGGARRQRIRL